MAGRTLHDFDLDLCDYILGQIRPHLCELPARPSSEARDRAGQPVWLRHMEWELLDMPAWAGRVVSALPVELADYVWMGVDGEAVPRRLNDPELAWLAFAFDDPPGRLESACVWTPFPALHRRAVECVPEITCVLTKQTAEEWTADSAGFAAKLCTSGLSLAEGIAIVRDWLLCARRLLRVIGVCASPPSSESSRAPSLGLTVRPSQRRGPPDAGRANAQDAQAQLSGSAVCGWQEAMEVTGLKKTKLYELFHAGVLKGYRDGAMIRFYRTALLGYMRDRENSVAPPLRPARRPRKAGMSKQGTRFKYL